MAHRSIVLTLGLLSTVPAMAQSPACVPRHQSCDTWTQKALGTAAGNADDFQQMKRVCAEADSCERTESNKFYKDAVAAHAKREAEEDAARAVRDREQRERAEAERVEAARRVVESEREAADAKAARRPIAYSAAICAYQELAKGARPLHVTTRTGNLITTRDISRGAILRSTAQEIKQIRARAHDEQVALLPCARIRGIVHCALHIGEDGCDSDVVTDVTDLMHADE